MFDVRKLHKYPQWFDKFRNEKLKLLILNFRYNCWSSRKCYNATLMYRWKWHSQGKVNWPYLLYLLDYEYLAEILQTNKRTIERYIKWLRDQHLIKTIGYIGRRAVLVIGYYYYNAYKKGSSRSFYFNNERKMLQDFPGDRKREQVKRKTINGFGEFAKELEKILDQGKRGF